MATLGATIAGWRTTSRYRNLIVLSTAAIFWHADFHGSRILAPKRGALGVRKGGAECRTRTGGHRSDGPAVGRLRLGPDRGRLNRLHRLDSSFERSVSCRRNLADTLANEDYLRAVRSGNLALHCLLRVRRIVTERQGAA